MAYEKKRSIVGSIYDNCVVVFNDMKIVFKNTCESDSLYKINKSNKNIRKTLILK